MESGRRWAHNGAMAAGQHPDPQRGASDALGPSGPGVAAPGGTVASVRGGGRERRGPRANGFVILLGCVVLGMVPTSIYFHWKVPDVIEEFQELVANAPKTPVARLEQWFELNQPQIHNRLKQFRLSEGQPWLVTHALMPAGVEPTDYASAVDAFGIDFRELPIDVVRLDGLEVSIVLDAPTAKGRVRLEGLNAPLVPRYPHDAELPPGEELAIELIEGALRRPDDFLEAYRLDNPGASFVIRVGDAERTVASSPLPEPVDAAPGEGAE